MVNDEMEMNETTSKKDPVETTRTKSNIRFAQAALIKKRENNRLKAARLRKVKSSPSNAPPKHTDVGSEQFLEKEEESHEVNSEKVSETAPVGTPATKPNIRFAQAAKMSKKEKNRLKAARLRKVKSSPPNAPLNHTDVGTEKNFEKVSETAPVETSVTRFPMQLVRAAKMEKKENMRLKINKARQHRDQKKSDRFLFAKKNKLKSASNDSGEV